MEFFVIVIRGMMMVIVLFAILLGIATMLHKSPTREQRGMLKQPPENKWDEVEVDIEKPVYVTDVTRPSDKVYLIKRIIFEPVSNDVLGLHISVVAECITEGPDKGSILIQSSDYFNYVYNGD
jgi:hypothetical protein